MNKVIITEEMRFRQRVCEYALKKRSNESSPQISSEPYVCIQAFKEI